MPWAGLRPGASGPFAGPMNEIPKVVFSNPLAFADWTPRSSVGALAHGGVELVGRSAGFGERVRVGCSQAVEREGERAAPELWGVRRRELGDRAEHELE